ncbi:streptophobe family protein [Streptomyces prunicolor]|uniref:streptophobe family protein n=1 Tax=Streptomyces prunicolor TaxID=67348 RepID=UPI0037D6AADA
MPASPSRASAPASRPWGNALEGAAAALCAVVAMAAASAIALAIFGPRSTGSLWSLTMAVTALAVGGSMRIGPDPLPMPAAQPTGGAAANMSMSGTAHVFPLAVTLAGAVVFWLLFSRRLRQRQFDVGALAARTVGAVVAAVLVLWGTATLAHGTFSAPTPSEGTGAFGLGGKLEDLLEKLFGGGGLAGGASGGAAAAAPPPMTYHVQAGATVLGALVWTVVVIAVGFLISRRVPPGFPARGLRAAWAPSASSAVRIPLVVAAVMTIVGAVAAGDTMAAGGALLLTPISLVTVLSLGLGSTWTSSTRQVQSAAAAQAAGQQASGQAATPLPDHNQHLGALTVGGVPVWIAAIVVTVLVLLSCAYVAARATDPGHARPLHPWPDGSMARHLGLAERFGFVTAVVLGGAAALAQVSFRTGVTMAGHVVGGTEVKLGGGVLWTFVAGLLAGAVAGFAGSLLQGVGQKSQASRLPRRSPVTVGGGHVPSDTAVEPGA